ncbi:MAG TPA: Asp23/Gls24 family envelope stress response protein [Candidatus Limnocylindrales bacterium]
MPDDRLPGDALVTRRAVGDIVRSVTLGSYGVVDVGGSPLARWLGGLAGRPPGVRVSLAGNRLELDLRIRVARGVPIAEVARQVESAIRFAIRRAFRRDVDRLTIRIAGLGTAPASVPPQAREQWQEPGQQPSDLAESGTDVA